MRPDERPESADGWLVVLALKPLRSAKSRIAWSPTLRRRLVLAMVRDVVSELTRCPSVAHTVLVCADPLVAVQLRGEPVVIVDDEPTGGLNAAFSHGAHWARARWPARGVALLTADLPAVTPVEIGLALAATGRHGLAAVPDRSGTGTTMLAAGPARPIDPSFGDGSFARHVRAGARSLDDPVLRGLRLDVDSLHDLADAAALGLGPYTDALLRAVDEHTLDKETAHADRPSAPAGAGGRDRGALAGLPGRRPVAQW